MKFDEAKNTGIAVATASILNEVKLLINRKITVNYKCNSYKGISYDFYTVLMYVVLAVVI
ncbi:hypothetical protein GCM10025777_07050 [Membranihabitans marinus]